MPDTSDTTHLQCLQVWGGSEAANQTLRMTGLLGYLYARPHEGAERGGDVYYVSSCASGRITRVLLADVSGHGSRVAAIADELRSIMQRYVNFTSQPKFMKAMNKRFAEVSDVGRFATTVALSFFSPTRKLSLSNAGHPAPLWYRAKDKQWVALGLDPEAKDVGPADLPLGIIDDAGYHQVDITFEPGDLLLMYTDALIESRGADGRMLGVRGLADRVSRLSTRQPVRIVPELIDRLTQDDEHDLTDDDVTVLLIHAHGTKREWKKMALSPFTLVRGMLRGVPPGT